MKTTTAVTLLTMIFASCGSLHSVSPLIAAARSGDIPALQAQLRNGADPNETGGVNGWTALQHAIHKNQPASVAALLAGGADPNARRPGGQTPLMMAAGYGQEQMVRLLLQKGANPRLRNAHGGTGIDLAVSGVSDIDSFTAGRCQTGTVKALLEAAPDIHPSASGLSKALSLMRGNEGCAELRQLLAARH